MDTATNNDFTKNYINHFLNPRNIGEIENADGYARIGDPSWGDFIFVSTTATISISISNNLKVYRNQIPVTSEQPNPQQKSIEIFLRVQTNAEMK